MHQYFSYAGDHYSSRKRSHFKKISHTSPAELIAWNMSNVHVAVTSASRSLERVKTQEKHHTPGGHPDDWGRAPIALDSDPLLGCDAWWCGLIATSYVAHPRMGAYSCADI
jgi:hypothetical protein